MNLIPILTLSVALGCGLMAGVFFAFSTFVMRALAELQPEQGVLAMQAINRSVINRWFLGVFVGTASGCLLLGGVGLWELEQPGSTFLIAGGSFYLVGTFLVTVVFNVPMNGALERVDPASPEAPERWANYLTRWTSWNHARTVAALFGAATLTFALW